MQKEVDLQIDGLGANYVLRNEVQVLWSSLSLVHMSCFYLAVVSSNSPNLSVLQKQMRVFNLTGEEYVWSAVAEAVFLASFLFHHHVAARRRGLSILPECHPRREQRSGAHVVL